VAMQRDGWLRSWMVNYAEGCVTKQRDGRLRIWTVSYAEGCVAKQRDSNPRRCNHYILGYTDVVNVYTFSWPRGEQLFWKIFYLRLISRIFYQLIL
jgi:hypothetical protein